jgi:hypothetical protein
MTPVWGRCLLVNMRLPLAFTCNALDSDDEERRTNIKVEA